MISAQQLTANGPSKPEDESHAAIVLMRDGADGEGPLLHLVVEVLAEDESPLGGESDVRRQREDDLEGEPMAQVGEVARLAPVVWTLGEGEDALVFNRREAGRQRVKLHPKLQHREAEGPVQETVNEEPCTPDRPVAAPARILLNRLTPEGVPCAGAEQDPEVSRHEGAVKETQRGMEVAKLGDDIREVAGGRACSTGG